MHEQAFAKLTLSLRVVGVRADGYHLLDSEMVAVDLADDLWFDEGGSGLVVEGPASRGVPADGSNLVARALVAVGRRAGVGVRVRKVIPPGAGLGGGSADAAAVLRWAGCSSVEVAASLGADVPFCVVGGRARVRGVGEVVEPLAFEARAFTLLVPPLPVSTPAVYAAWDALGGPAGEGVNDLEPAAMVVEPELAVWRDRLGDATGVVPTLAGSGATWFVPGEHPGEGRVVVRTVPPLSGA